MISGRRVRKASSSHADPGLKSSLYMRICYLLDLLFLSLVVPVPWLWQFPNTSKFCSWFLRQSFCSNNFLSKFRPPPVHHTTIFIPVSKCSCICGNSRYSLCGNTHEKVQSTEMGCLFVGSDPSVLLSDWLWGLAPSP